MDTRDILDAMRSWLETVEIVPSAYAEYTPLVIDGLLDFLGRLPSARLEAIVAAQLELAGDASADDRFVALLRECPTLHKLGQVIARQAGLPAALRRRLQVLESMTPPRGAYGIAEIVERELGCVPGLTVGAEALAEGSVAFVVPFEWRDGTGPVRRGVFKALKPGAEARLTQDLAVWPATGDFLAARSSELDLAAVDFRSLLDGVAGLLRNEIKLDGEQARLTRARSFYAGDAGVVIPALFGFCTPRLTAMERIDGVKVTDAKLGDGARRQLARTIVAALLAKPFWSPANAEPFFHADPHAGNMFATSDGKLAIFDWALTTTLSPAQSAAVVETLVSAALLDEMGVIRALGVLGSVRDAPLLAAGVAEAVGRVRRGMFPGFGWLTPLLDRLGRDGTIVFPEETALFRKSLLTLSGVIRDVWPNASIDEVLVAGGGRQFLAEAWIRPLEPFESRRLGTHVSNGDIVRLMSSSAFAPARYWLGAYRDALETIVR